MSMLDNSHSIITPVPKRLLSCNFCVDGNSELYKEPEIIRENSDDDVWDIANREFAEIMSRSSLSSEPGDEDPITEPLLQPQRAHGCSWRMKTEEIAPNHVFLHHLTPLPIAPSPIRRAENPLPLNPSFSFLSAPLTAP
ncbi:uncharacterized protein VTP21DRAFT_2112 [Calcarisporiella thermophila]|uniref:uncharacterized protein n=1 Tax=Calcarisporiella thermophila TaxID=911321 RepID=UPI00374225F7